MLPPDQRTAVRHCRTARNRTPPCHHCTARVQDLIGALILAANAAMMAAFALLLGRRLWPAARRLVGSWVRAPAWYHRWTEGRTADDLATTDK